MISILLLLHSAQKKLENKVGRVVDIYFEFLYCLPQICGTRLYYTNKQFIMSSKRIKKGYLKKYLKKQETLRVARLIAAYSSSERTSSDNPQINRLIPIPILMPPVEADLDANDIREALPHEMDHASMDAPSGTSFAEQDLGNVDLQPQIPGQIVVFSNNDPPSPPSFVSRLSSWAVKERISHSSLLKLLQILKNNVSMSDLESLPSDPRTLLQTPSKLDGVVSMGPGSYYYFGIKHTIVHMCQNLNITLEPGLDKFYIATNIDGVPLFKSSNLSFWPILCLIKTIKGLESEVFCVGLYLGRSKPDVNDFLFDFVTEIKNLVVNGICIEGKIYEFKLQMLICDTPAKSYILNIKGHSGFFSCTKCTIEGDFGNSIYFSETEFVKRTDESFRTRLQPEHHVGKTLWEEIPQFDMINGVPIDYMHCILLGVTKRLLCHRTFGWVFGKPPFKLRACNVNRINADLLKLKTFIPCEFARKTRSLLECKRFKATEFRLLLLYVGIIVFKDVLPKKYYHNFLCLSLATNILCNAEYIQTDNYFLDYANDLFKHFVLNSKKLYRPDFISHNVHNLLHITDCVRFFGVFDNFSAFPFENFMPQLTKNVRKASLPLQQVIKRLAEKKNLRKQKESPQLPVIALFEHSNGPLLGQCTSPQYKVVKTKNYTFNVSKLCDSFVELNNNQVFEIKNFATCKGEIVALGFNYLKTGSFFKKPIDSLTFGIGYINKNGNLLSGYPLSFIKRKIVVLPYNNQYISLPLAH